MSIGDTCSFLQMTCFLNSVFVTLFVTLKAKTALQISVMPFSAVRGVVIEHSPISHENLNRIV